MLTYQPLHQPEAKTAHEMVKQVDNDAAQAGIIDPGRVGGRPGKNGEIHFQRMMSKVVPAVRHLPP